MFQLLLAFFVGLGSAIFILRLLAQSNNDLALGIIGSKRPPKPLPVIQVSPVIKEEPHEERIIEEEIALRKRAQKSEELLKEEKPKFSPSQSPVIPKEIKTERPLQTSRSKPIAVATPTIGTKQALEQLDRPIMKKLLIPQHSGSHSPLPSPRKFTSFNGEDPKAVSSIHGWVEIRSKIGNNLLSKTVWHWRYMCVHGDWLSYYEDEKCIGSDCCGWVKLTGCFVAMREERELMVKNPKHKIFHRHGPDPNLPPCKKKHIVFHGRSKRVIIKCSDNSHAALWLAKLTEACALSSTFTTPVDSDNEDMYQEGGVLDSDDTETPNVVTEQISVLDPNEGRVVVRRLSTVSHGDLTPKKREGDSFFLNRGSLDLPAAAQSPRSVGTPVKEHTEEEKIIDEEKLGDEVAKDPENREGLLKLLTKAVGLDITTISLPVSLNEPTSFLQRMCEVLAYVDLLDQAGSCEDSCQRLMYVAAFATSLFCGNVRTTKPFNPYLGETFEYQKRGQYKFIAEQVCHHPPVAASFAENDNWSYCQEQGLKTKFGGNSLACEGVGFNHVRLKKFGEHYSWSGVKSVVHNVILGSMWLDHFGDFEITNHKTGEKARLDLTKCGWFGKGQYETKGWILNSSGKTRISIEGKWNKSLEATVVTGESLPIRNPIWIHTNVPDKSDPWLLSPFAQELNRMDEKMKSSLPPTDSRLRMDRLALEMRNNSKASEEKRILEERQRSQAKQRELKGEVWKPKYFVHEVDQDNHEGYWRYNGTYWSKK